jgi:hypothetical protein
VASWVSTGEAPCENSRVTQLSFFPTLLAFVTEPLIASLANVLGDTNGLASVSKELKDYELDELEVWDISLTPSSFPSVIHPTISFQVQKGLSVLAQGLDFCHSNAKLIHGDINPRSIFVNVKVTSEFSFFSFFFFCFFSLTSTCFFLLFSFQGDWKIGSFAFSTPVGSFMFPGIDPSLPPYCQPDLNFLGRIPTFLSSSRDWPNSTPYLDQNST